MAALDRQVMEQDGYAVTGLPDISECFTENTVGDEFSAQFYTDLRAIYPMVTMRQLEMKRKDGKNEL